jgi:FkbM family methyltransferase
MTIASRTISAAVWNLLRVIPVGMIIGLMRILPSRLVRSMSAAQWRVPALRAIYLMVARSVRNRDGIIARGTGRGLKFNVGNGNAGYLLGTSEPSVQAAFEAFVRPGATVFDVGANVGFLTAIAARLTGPGGRVIAFEPLPANAAQIRANAAMNGFAHVDVRTEALGNIDGEMPFLVSAESSWGKIRLEHETVAGQVREIPVRVRTLDGLRRENEVPAPDLIKMDIEGGEAALLEGAGETLRRDRPVLLIELHGTNAAVADHLRRGGYEATVIGCESTVSDAPWDAYVVAVPSEEGSLVERARAFRSPGLEPR